MILLGDIHGYWYPIINFLKDFDIRGETIIQVGDFGLFSHDDLLSAYTLLNGELEKRDCQLLIVKGNHERPSLWNEGYILGRIVIVPDYYIYTIQNKRILFIGGAISIDRKLRTKGVDYFPEEEIRRPTEEELRHIKAAPIDIIVSHDAPLCAGKNPSTLWDDPDNPVKTDAIRGRKILSEIQEIVRPKHWFYGHYHFSDVTKIDETEFRCLNVNEFYEFKA